MARTRSRLAGLLLGLALLPCCTGRAGAERLVQSSTEARTYVHLAADGDAVRRLLPAGWAVDPGAGPLEGANLSIAFIEGIATDGPDGGPVPDPGRYAVLLVPAREERTGTAGVTVVGGFASRPQDAPGAYGVYAPGRVEVARSSRSGGAGPTTVEEVWDVSSGDGDRLRLAIAFERGVGARAHVEPRIYSAVGPAFYRVYKADQVADVVHSPAAGGRRAARLEFGGSGPRLAGLLDGGARVVAVTSVPAYFRRVVLPD